MLIENKIDVNWKNNYGWNALHCVCRFQPENNLKSLVELLVKNKIDKNAKTIGNKIGGWKEIGTARSFLLERFLENEIKDVIQMLDSNA
jgi:ankyrin repeat protein